MLHNLDSTLTLFHNSLQENWAHQDICTFSLIHIWTCYIWKLENESAFTDHAKKWEPKKPSPFIILSEKIVQAASSARKANEWKGEQSANNGPWLQIKVSVLLLSPWAPEMLLRVLIRKRKILKEMWAACPGCSFITPTTPCQTRAEIMLAGVAGQAEALGKIKIQMNISVSRDLSKALKQLTSCPALFSFWAEPKGPHHM